MELSRLRELITYEPQTGILRNAKSQRQLTPDEYGAVVVYDNITKKRHKMRAAKIAYELGNNKRLADSQRILHRNLNETDNRLQNLLAVTRTVFLQLQEAIRNLDHQLRMIPHPEDQYSYIITYRDKGVEKNEVKHDIIAAKQRLLRLQLKYAKLLNKYCIFD